MKISKTSLLRLLLCFIFGGVFVSIGDIVHVMTLTAGYRSPYWFGLIAWWVPLLFGVATLALIIGQLQLHQYFQQELPKVNFMRVVLSAEFFLLVYVLSGALVWPVLQKSLLLYALGFASIFIWQRTTLGFILALVTAFGGMMAEAFIVSTGRFYYTQPDIFGVPVWLGALYLAASVAAGNLAGMIKK